MRKKIYTLGLLLLFILIMSGCGKSVLKEADSYNKYTMEQIGALSTEGEWNVAVLAFDEKTCILQKSRMIGVPTPGVKNKFENEFYVLDRSSGEMNKINPEGIKTYDTFWETVMLGEDRILLWDLDYGDMYFYDSSYQLLDMKNAYELGIYREEERDPVYGIYGVYVCVEADPDYLYVYQETIDETMKLDILNREMEIVYTQEGKLEDVAYRLCPNLSERCLFAREEGDDVSFWRYEEAENRMVEMKNKRIRGQAEIFFYTDKFCGDEFYDCYFYEVNSTPKTEYSYDVLGLKDGVFYKLMNYDQMNWRGPGPYYATDGKGGFLVVDSDMFAEAELLVKLTPGETVMNTSLKEGKTVACIAGIAGMEELKKYVSGFNASSEEYYIEIKDYSATHEDYLDAVKAMNLDLTTEEAVDGIALFQADRENLIKNGYLEPLNDYLAQSTVLSEETIQDFVWECMKEEDGTIYSVYPEFSLEGVLSKEKPDLANLLKYQDENKEGSVFAKQEPTGLLCDLLRYSGDRFVDEKQKSVHLGEEFLKLLEVVKLHAGDDVEMDTGALLLQQGEVMASYETIDFPYTYYFHEYIFDGEYACTNYGADAPILVPGFLEMGLLAASDSKEAIYAFWDYMYEDVNYNRNFGKIAFPILKSSWNDWEKRLTTTEDYTDRQGNMIYAVEFPYKAGGVEIAIPPMKQEDVDRMLDMMHKSVSMQPMKSEYLDIMMEEAELYFEGARPLEAVRDNIENRIQNALNE